MNSEGDCTNLLLGEMVQHLSHSSISYEIHKDYIFKHVTTQEVDGETKESVGVPFTNIFTAKLLQTACQAFLILSRLRINPGIVALEKYEYIHINNNEIRPVVVVTEPFVQIHGFNCTCGNIEPHISCYEACGRQNLKYLAMELRDNLHSQLLHQDRCPLTGEALDKPPITQTVIRCLDKGMSLLELSRTVGWTMDLNTVTFKSWCKCPCRGETYDPNDLDKLVIRNMLKSVTNAEPLENMLYRVIPRCRHLYLDMPTKVKALIHICNMYMHPIETAAYTGGNELNQIISFFNCSFFHHIAPNAKPNCLN